MEQSTEYKDGNLVCKLNKAFYSLVQLVYLWFEDMKSILLSMRLIQSKHNDALFYNREKKTYIIVYMDDIKTFAPIYGPIDDVKEKLFAKYQIIDEGNIK